MGVQIDTRVGTSFLFLVTRVKLSSITDVYDMSLQSGSPKKDELAPCRVGTTLPWNKSSARQKKEKPCWNINASVFRSANTKIYELKQHSGLFSLNHQCQWTFSRVSIIQELNDSYQQVSVF